MSKTIPPNNWENKNLTPIILEQKRKEALKILKELSIKNQHLKCPTFPIEYLPKPKYEDRTANGLTKCIIDYIKFSGGQAERINSTGRPIDQRKTYTDVLGRTRQVGGYKWVFGTGTKGTADISATINGKSIKIEVKIGNDKQSEAQEKYQCEIERAGGIYVIAKTFEQFYLWYQKTFKV